MNLRNRPQNSSGIVLVMTVLVMSIVVLLVYAFSLSAGVNLGAARNARESLRRDLAAESALNWGLAILRLDAMAGSADTLSDSWAAPGRTVTVGNIQCTLDISDENRKLNINRATRAPANPALEVDLREPLKRLILTLGGAAGDYERLAECINPGYASDGMVAKYPLLQAEAVRSIPNLSSALFTAALDRPVLDALLCTHPARINVNTASKEVLDCLWPDVTVSERLLAQRNLSPFRSDAEVADFMASLTSVTGGGPWASLLSAGSDYFTIAVRPDQGGEDTVALVRRVDTTVQILRVSRLTKEAAL